MGSGRGCIELVRANNLILKAKMEQVHDLLKLVAFICEQIFNRVNIIVVPFQFESWRLRDVTAEGRLVFLTSENGSIEQVIYLLVVYLHEGDIDSDFAHGLHTLHLLHKHLRTSLHQTFFRPLLELGKQYPFFIWCILVALHSVGLSRACLTVSKDCAVKSFYHLFHHEWNIGLFENLLLGSCRG